MRKYEFDHIVAAGSWDHFHDGHKDFLSRAFQISRQVSVGITSDKMIVKKRFFSSIEDFSKRKQGVEAFLRSKDYLPRTKIVKLEDIYGPALTDETIEALVVTSSTISGAEKVSKKRKHLGLSKLQLIKVKMKTDH